MFHDGILCHDFQYKFLTEVTMFPVFLTYFFAPDKSSVCPQPWLVTSDRSVALVDINFMVKSPGLPVTTECYGGLDYFRDIFNYNNNSFLVANIRWNLTFRHLCNYNGLTYL